jgi:adenosylcobinamide-GDP ribazoletransferase
MIRVWLRALAGAFTFLTVLPVARAASGRGDLRHVAAFFPIVGLAIGAVLAGAAWLARGHLPHPLAAVLLVALGAALTGGLHLDGVADLFDGLGHGGRDPRRALEIMRDSRIGAHGAVALILLLAAKSLAVAVLLERGQLSALAVFPAAARGCVVPFIVALRPARREGLGWALHRASGPGDALCAVLLAAAAVAAVPALGGAGLAAAALAALLAAAACAAWARLRLGGLTGDVHGAAIELAEAAFLIVAARN